MPIWGQVELLCRAVIEEGRKEAEFILSQARVEAERTLTHAMEAMQAEAEKEIFEHRSSAHAQARRIIDSAELDARKRIMAFREEMVREVFDALRKRIEKFCNDPSYPDFLISALVEGTDRLFGNSFIVELSAQDLELYGKSVKKLAGEKGFSIELKPSPFFGGGIRIYSSDGTRLYDNSLMARLNRSEATIRQEIWRNLLETARESD